MLNLAEISTRPSTQDIRFVKEFVAASGEDSIKGMMIQGAWSFQHFGYAPEGKIERCDACNQRVKNFAVVSNSQSGVMLQIGLNCYDKFNHLFKVGKLPARSSKEEVKKIKKILTDAAKKAGVKLKKGEGDTFLDFFWQKYDQLSDELQQTVRTIDAIGFAPSVECAEKLVDFYLANKLVSVEALLSWEDQQRFWDYESEVESFLTDGCLTLNALPAFLELLNEAQALVERREEEQEARQEAIQMWEEFVESFPILWIFRQALVLGKPVIMSPGWIDAHYGRIESVKVWLVCGRMQLSLTVEPMCRTHKSLIELKRGFPSKMVVHDGMTTLEEIRASLKDHILQAWGE